MIGGLSAISGPILGGILIHANLFGTGWRSVFLINVPVGLAATVLAVRLLPDARSPLPRGIDGSGTALLGAAMAALLYPLVRGHELGWQPWHFALLAVAPAASVVVWRRTVRREHAGQPVVFPTALARQRQFVMGLSIALVFGIATGGFLFVFAFGAQTLRGYSPLETGLLHVPFSAGVMFGIAFLGRKLLAIHGKWVIAGGIGLMAVFAGTTLVWIGSDAPYIWVLPCLGLAGMGMGMTSGPLTPVMLARVDRGHAGAASGVVKTVQELGMALGVAIVGTAYFAGSGKTMMPAIAVIELLMLAALTISIRLPSPLFPEQEH